jgi:hypothetical protein
LLLRQARAWRLCWAEDCGEAKLDVMTNLWERWFMKQVDAKIRYEAVEAARARLEMIL